MGLKARFATRTPKTNRAGSISLRAPLRPAVLPTVS